MRENGIESRLIPVIYSVFFEYIPFGRVGLGSRKHGSTDQNHQNYIKIALLYIHIYMYMQMYM